MALTVEKLPATSDQTASQHTKAPDRFRATFAKTGEYWSLGIQDHLVSLKDSSGLRYLQYLLRRPGEEIHAVDLQNVSSEPATDSGSGGVLDASTGMSARRDLGDAGEMLDSKAKAEYRKRLTSLRTELEEAREMGDIKRAENLESEVEFLVHEISRAVGLGGRDRRAASSSERARVNVTKAIKLTLRHIAEHDGRLADLLSQRIRTGTFCSCSPDPLATVTWEFSIDRVVPPKPEPADGPIEESAPPFDLTDRTAFVGREKESAQVLSYMESAMTGRGRFVAIGGPPGVGKTRLANEIANEAARRGMQVVSGGCYDREGRLSYSPFVEILDAELAQARSPETFRESLGINAAELARILPQLRQIFSDLPPPLEIPPEQSRHMLFTAVAEFLWRRARNRPQFLLIEDIHWADEATLLLLDFLARRLSEARIIIVATYRDGEVDLAGPLAKTLDTLIRLRTAAPVVLSPLSRPAVAEMLRDLSRREVPDHVVDLIYSNTEGNPFFIEELFRHLLEQGKILDSAGKFQSNIQTDGIDVPEGLRIVIGRRLAKLSQVTRQMLSMASTIGRTFSLDLLEVSSAESAQTVTESIEEAETAGLVSALIPYTDGRYTFSHEVVRQSVIGQIATARRLRLHLQVAKAIEFLYPHALDDHANDLAHHLWLAGPLAEPGKTIRYLSVVAQRATAQSAYEAALRDLGNALQLLGRLPDVTERSQQELDLLIPYGVTLLATRGWHASELQIVHNRTRELCIKFGREDELFSVLFGLWGFHLVRGEHRIARDLAEELMRLSRHSKNNAFIMVANWSSGGSLFFLGEPQTALDYLESAIASRQRAKPSELTFLYGQDPGMISVCYSALALWLLGRPDLALQRAEQTLALAVQAAHPYNLAWCLTNLSIFHMLRRDWLRAMQLTQEGLAICTERGLGHAAASMLQLQTLIMAGQGNMERANQYISVRKAAPEISGQLMHAPWFCTTLAEIYGALGQTDTAFSLLRAATSVMTQTNERFYEAETHRIMGELLFHLTPERRGSQADGAGFEDRFLEAIEIARGQGARTLELRAATGLSRCWQSEGRQADARHLLTTIYDSFTEGFGSDDLQQAAALLKELG